MKTYMAKPEEIRREWYLIDAQDSVLGRMASRIATILRGKDKAEWTAHIDTGDMVVVINADKVKVTGKKMSQKLYKSYSGYPGGLKQRPMKDVLKTEPEKIIFHAVQGMLPHNKLGREQIKKLKIYAGPFHPHKAQNPQVLKI